MKKTTYNKSSIMSRANALRKIYGMSKSDSLRKAWGMAKLDILEGKVWDINGADKTTRAQRDEVEELSRKISELKQAIYPTVNKAEVKKLNKFDIDCLKMELESLEAFEPDSNRINEIKAALESGYSMSEHVVLDTNAYDAA